MSLKTGSSWSNWAWDKPVKAFIWRSSRICRPTGGLPPWFFEESLPHLLFRNNSIIDTCDMPTEYDSPIYRGHQPASDAACVALARQAGGILIGKTVTTEFANVSPGKTRHPRDPQRMLGGSSSGSAAAVS